MSRVQVPLLTPIGSPREPLDTTHGAFVMPTHRFWSRPLPGPGETVGGGRLSRSPGGKGANQAAAAARLGARTRMVGAVGPDAEGRAMKQALQEAGVIVDDIAEATVETGTALIMVDAAGQN